MRILLMSDVTPAPAIFLPRAHSHRNHRIFCTLDVPRTPRNANQHSQPNQPEAKTIGHGCRPARSLSACPARLDPSTPQTGTKAGRIGLRISSNNIQQPKIHTQRNANELLITVYIIIMCWKDTCTTCGKATWAG